MWAKLSAKKKSIFFTGTIIGLMVIWVGIVAIIQSNESDRLAIDQDSGAPAQQVATGGRKHFILNSQAGDANKLKSLGYSVQDVGPDAGEIRSLPSGVQGMVWTGNIFCEKPMNWTAFKKFVAANKSNTKIYGYFLQDEPQTDKCPGIVKVIRDRADYIHCLAIRGDKHANGMDKVAANGSCLDSNGKKVARKTPHKAYIVDEWDHKYDRVRESLTHVDLFAIDPYPCRAKVKACKFTGSPDYFRERIERAKKYFTDAHIVPTYQGFGGDGWRLPSVAEMKQILAEYDRALPKVDMDVVYSYRDNKSGGPSDTYPGLIRSAALQKILKDHNAKY